MMMSYWINHLRPNWLNVRAKVGSCLSYVGLWSYISELSFEIKPSLSLISSVEQLGELRQQLEKERNLKSEEATRAFENVKLEMESKRQDLEARQKKVEAVVTEVHTFFAFQSLYCSPLILTFRGFDIWPVFPFQLIGGCYNFQN